MQHSLSHIAFIPFGLAKSFMQINENPKKFIRKVPHLLYVVVNVRGIRSLNCTLRNNH